MGVRRDKNGKQVLTKRQDKFVDAIISPETKSQTEAALKANYSPNTAKVIASENLTKPYIVEEIQKRKERLARLAEVHEKEVMGATVEIAFASIEDALDDDGNLDFAKAKANGSVSLIKKITRNPTKYGETVAVEFYPKDQAQARLGEYLGMKTKDKENPVDVITKIEQDAAERGKTVAEHVEDLAKGFREKYGGVKDETGKVM